MKHKLLSSALLLCLAALFFHCKKSEGPYVVPDFEEPEKPPPPSLVGKWKEEYTPGYLFGGTNLSIEFLADGTFHMDFKMWSDTPTGEPCPNTRTDHILGEYWSKDGYLRLSGKYCDPTFSTAKPNCEGFSGYVRFSTCQLSAQTLTLGKAGSEFYPRKLKRQ